MIDILAALLFTAFPVRGSVWKSIDSVLVIDGDSLRIEQACLTGYCERCRLQFKDHRDSALFGVFPGSRRDMPEFMDLTWSNYVYFQTTPPTTSCVAGANFSAEPQRLFVVHGKSDWALLADSVDYKIADGRIQKPVGIRWRWCRIDTSMPWVRWVDTVSIGRSGAAPVGLPVLTTFRPTTFGYLAPRSEMANLGLVLRDRTDTAAPVEWGFRLRLLPTPSLVPAGRTFRILDAFNPVGGVVWWDLAGNTDDVDKFVMVGAGTTGVPPLATSGPVRRGTVGIEVSTGRRIRLDSPRPSGLQLLPGPRGIRMVLVE